MTYDLYTLIKENKVDALKAAIESGADINMQGENGNTPLLLALLSNKKGVKDKIIECLLNYHPDVTIANKDGTTPLHIAIIKKEIKFIKTLIERGADITARGLYQYTPLLQAVDSKWRWYDMEVIKCLLKNGADINARDRDDKTALHHAVEEICPKENQLTLVEYLLQNGADINAQDEVGRTPLLLVLWSSSVSALWGNEEGVKDETIECLLNYNPDVTIANKDGTTPLHVAVTGNNIKFIKTLIEKGADINAQVWCQYTPLLQAVDTSRRWYDMEVIKCLLENGADINVRDKYGKTALHHVIEEICPKENPLTLIECLLQNGANINAQDEEGFTPLLRAIYDFKLLTIDESLIVLLLRYNPDVTIKDKRGRIAASYMSKSADLSKCIKGKILSLCLSEDPMMQCLKSEEFQRGFCKNTSLPTELYLDIVDYAKSYILEDIGSEIPLQDKLDWLKAYKEETRRKRQEQASEAEEQALPCEIRCRP
jgi:ankyrin repeat protein